MEGLGGILLQAAGKWQLRVQIINQRNRLIRDLQQDHMVVLEKKRQKQFQTLNFLQLAKSYQACSDITDPDDWLVSMSRLLFPQRDLMENNQRCS